MQGSTYLLEIQLYMLKNKEMTLQGETESDNINKTLLAQVFISGPNFSLNKTDPH